MFTGIVQAVGSVDAIEPLPAGKRFRFALGALAGRHFNLGDSIAVNGACLTVVALDGRRFDADLSSETLRVTTLGRLVPGSPVNLEPALGLGESLGGHLVTGHVDGVGEVVRRDDEGGTALLRFRLPAALGRYAARKGSVCVDGVSLTVNDVADGPAGTEVLVTLVPHTLAHTIMHTYRAGTPVNIEVDLLARYVERLMVRT